MPSQPNPYGLQFIEYKGGKNRAAVNTYYLASGYGTNIGYGDPISPAVAGLCAIGQVPANETSALTLSLGVFSQVQYTNAQGISGPPVSFWPANTVTQNALPAKITVNDLPYCVFQIQTNATLGGPSTFKNFNFSLGAGANAATGQSRAVLDVAGGGGAEVFRSLKIVGLADPAIGQTNAWTDDYVDVLVMINYHVFKRGTLGTN